MWRYEYVQGDTKFPTLHQHILLTGLFWVKIFFYFWREKKGGGIEERCDDGKVVYHVFKLCLMKMKYYNLYNK